MLRLGKSMALAAAAAFANAAAPQKSVAPAARGYHGIMGLGLPMVKLERPRHSGPSRKTLYTHHKKVGRSRYRPHQGDQERFRRWKRMELARGED